MTTAQHEHENPCTKHRQTLNCQTFNGLKVHIYTYTHTPFLTAIFPGEHGLAGSPLNSPSPFIPKLCILLRQAQTFHVILNIIPLGLFREYSLANSFYLPHRTMFDPVSSSLFFFHSASPNTSIRSYSFQCDSASIHAQLSQARSHCHASDNSSHK